jgi:hypothetical protein
MSKVRLCELLLHPVNLHVVPAAPAIFLPSSLKNPYLLIMGQNSNDIKQIIYADACK